MPAGFTASIAATAGSNIVRKRKNPPTSTAATASPCAAPVRPDRVHVQTAAAMVSAPSASAPSTCSPPEAQASFVGGIATMTAPSPPSATNPITPMLNSPANPHCRFTPSAMIALTRPMFATVRAVFHP